MSAPKNRKTLIFEVDGDELACRIAEMACDIKRPAGMTAAAALASMSRVSQANGSPDVVPGFRRAAQAAVEYFAECAGKATRPS